MTKSLFDITSIEAQDEIDVHMEDAHGVKQYGPDDLPVTITLGGPGSDLYQEASDAQQARALERAKRFGDKPMTGPELRERNVLFLAHVSKRCSPNLAPPDVANREFFANLYRNKKIGFWSAQLNAKLTDWGNFTPSSPTT